MFTIHPSRQEMYADDAKFLWKYILRSLAIILAIISIGLIGWSLAHQVIFPNNIYANSNYAFLYWPYNSDIWSLPWQFISLSLSITWNIANILVLLLRNKPIAPGANVACDLLLWLALLVTSLYATLGATTYLWWDPNAGDFETQSYANGTTYSILPNGTFTNTTNTTSSSSPNPCETFTGCAAQYPYNNAIYNKGIVIAVGAAISFMVLLVHFALFVSACRYTNARRVDARAAVVVAERLCKEEMMARDAGAVGMEMERGDVNKGVVPVGEELARLDGGMSPALTGMRVGDRRRRREGGEEGEGQVQGRGTRYPIE